MPNLLGLAGASPQKQTRFAPIYTGRFSSGIWTNRSPLRDANTTRLTETFMQSVGNSLYFANGVDNKKWLQTLTVHYVSTTYGTSTTPLFSTFFIDPNGNIQQLTTAGISAGTAPVWSTTVPNSGNNFQGGVTTDGSAAWTNRGNPIENWGIAEPSTSLTPTVGSSRSAWKSNTVFGLVQVVIDSNGNLQQVSTAGTSGSGSHPTWATSVGLTTTDGTVVWTMIQTAASLIWQANTSYSAGHFIAFPMRESN